MLRFDEIGVLPEPGDNVAISSRRLEAGAVIDFAGTAVTLPHTVLEQLEVVGSQVLDERAGAVADDDVDEHEVDAAAKHRLRLGPGLSLGRRLVADQPRSGDARQKDGNGYDGGNRLGSRIPHVST